MPGRPMTDEQKRKKRERERERQNDTPLIAQTWWKKLAPQILFLDTKPFVISTDELFQEDAYF